MAQTVQVRAVLMDEISAGIKTVESNAKKGFEGVGKATEKAAKPTEKLSELISSKLVPALTMAAVAGAGFKLKGMLDEMAAVGDSIDKTSIKLGVSIEMLQEYRFAATQSGVSTSEMDMALQRFSRRLSEASDGTGAAVGAFGDLGIKLQDLNGKVRSAPEIMNDVADALRGVESESKKVSIATDLFGLSGANLLPLLNKGAQGLEGYRDQARELGIIMGQDAVNAAVEYTDSMDKLNRQIEAMKFRVLLPVMMKANKLLELFSQTLKNNEEALRVLGFIAGSAFKDLVGGASQLEQSGATLKTAFLRLIDPVGTAAKEMENAGHWTRELSKDTGSLAPNTAALASAMSEAAKKTHDWAEAQKELSRAASGPSIDQQERASKYKAFAEKQIEGIRNAFGDDELLDILDEPWKGHEKNLQAQGKKFRETHKQLAADRLSAQELIIDVSMTGADKEIALLELNMERARTLGSTGAQELAAMEETKQARIDAVRNTWSDKARQDAQQLEAALAGTYSQAIGAVGSIMDQALGKEEGLKKISRTVIQTIQQVIALQQQMAALQVAGAAGSLIGATQLAGGLGIAASLAGLFFHDGGPVGPLRRYHSGGAIARDERPAILQTGEHVLSRQDVSAMGGHSGVQRAKSSGGAMNISINLSGSATSADADRVATAVVREQERANRLMSSYGAS